MHCFLFDGLSKTDELNIFQLIGNAVFVNKGNELYKSGYLGIMKSGKATVKRTSGTGDSITMRTLFEGELFGAASVFGSWKEGLSSIVANCGCEVYYIPENVFKNILNTYPQVAINYISYLSDRIRFLNSRIDAFSAKSTENKLYEFLSSIADDKGIVKLTFGMSELARRLNIGRSSLYRDIDSLEKSGLIARNGQNFKILG